MPKGWYKAASLAGTSQAGVVWQTASEGFLLRAAPFLPAQGIGGGGDLAAAD